MLYPGGVQNPGSCHRQGADLPLALSQSKLLRTNSKLSRRPSPTTASSRVGEHRSVTNLPSDALAKTKYVVPNANSKAQPPLISEVLTTTVPAGPIQARCTVKSTSTRSMAFQVPSAITDFTNAVSAARTTPSKTCAEVQNASPIPACAQLHAESRTGVEPRSPVEGEQMTTIATRTFAIQLKTGRPIEIRVSVYPFILWGTHSHSMLFTGLDRDGRMWLLGRFFNACKGASCSPKQRDAPERCLLHT